MAEEKKKEYWRWTEYAWKNPDIDWRKADTITCGVDIGSVSTQAVIMTDGKIYCYSNLRTGSDSPESAHRGLSTALKDTDLKLENIQYTVGTGYGRINVPFANKTVTEIACHARGGNYMGGSTIRTILDMGGQDCKAIKVDETGRVVEFLMNDKCAAGTGRGMEVIADLMAVPITEVGKLSLDVKEEPPPVSSTCVVFAKTESLGLLRQGWTKNQVLAAYCAAMAHRVVTLLQRIGVQKDFTITGGISKNIGVVKRILDELKVESVPLQPDAQIAGGIGAALFAKDLLLKQRAAQKKK